MLIRIPCIHVLLLLVTINSIGCAEFNDSFSDDIDRTYNLWLGRTKDERIQMVGPPERCARLQSQEEVCSWDRMALDMPGVRRLMNQTIPSWMHHIVYVYDPSGTAKSWHYSGSWGERSSGDSSSFMPAQQSALLP